MSSPESQSLGPDAGGAKTAAANQRASESRRLRERYGILLLAIITAFVLQGVGSPGTVEQVLVSAVLAVTLLLALWAADAKPRVLRPAMVVCAAVVLTSVVASLQGHVDSAATRLANLLLVTLAPPAIVLGVLRSLRARNRVTVEAVFGVLCLYILLGMSFAFIYGAIGRLGASPFFAQDVSASVAQLSVFQLHDADHGRLRGSDRGEQPRPYAVGL